MGIRQNWKAIILGLLVAGLFVFLAYGLITHTDREATAETVRTFLLEIREAPWAFPMVLAIYVLAGIVMFPITALNLIMAMVFGPFWGILYALIGSMLNAAIYFGLGHVAGDRSLRRFLQGERISKIDKALRESGVIGITMLRFVPMAPYSVFNVVAGISSVRFLDFMAATFLSLVPGAIARGMVGDALVEIFLAPSWRNALYLSAGLAFWLAVVFSIHIAVKRWQREPEHG